MWTLVITLLVSPINLVSGLWFFHTKVCYEHIGCFSNEFPYDGYLYLVPASPDDMQIQFYLFTRQNPSNLHLLDPYDKDTITNSHFDGPKESILIIHGYTDSGTSAWQQQMKDEFLIKDDLNVIVVDWEKGADTLFYAKAAANTRVVGATIAELILALVSTGGSSFDNFTLVGHSLGAHIAGYAESYLNGSIATIFGFGLEQAVGDADFYPNGGQDQPGCANYLKKRFEIIEETTGSVACSHNRVLNLFLESINSDCIFTGFPCPSMEDYFSYQCVACGSGCAEMGYNSRKRGQGRYYFDTSETSPFCKED